MEQESTSFMGWSIKTDIPSVTSQTYIIVGNFDTLEEAKILKKYLETKFVRYLISLRKNTQDISITTFKFVPDIFLIKDKLKEINDKELFNYFNFSLKEIKIINNRIGNI